MSFRATASSSEKSHARKSQFREPIQRDLGRPVPREKIIRFVLSPNQWFPLRIPARSEGRTRRHGRWAGMRWTRERRETSAAHADGEIVWSWRSDAGAKLAGYDPQATVATKHGHRGDHV